MQGQLLVDVIPSPIDDTFDYRTLLYDLDHLW